MRTGHTLNAVYKSTNIPVLENTTLLAISISTTHIYLQILSTPSVLLVQPYRNPHVSVTFNWSFFYLLLEAIKHFS
jgi:hypothetical protein